MYLRPWVLVRAWATPEVCHLGDLALCVPRRLRSKTPADAAGRSYAASWRWYVRGHVVTQHARRIITQFLAACCGKSSKGDAHDDADEEEETKERVVPPNALPLARVHGVLERTKESARVG